MKEKIKNLDFKKKVTIFTFLLFLIIGILSPISGDDWKNYVIGRKGLLEVFNNINIKDGRVFSGIIIPFLTYHKLLFNILFALLISKFIDICNEFQGKGKSKFAYLHPLIAILAVSTFIFSYNYMSVESTIAYTFPILLFIDFFYILTKNDELTAKNIIQLFFISIFVTLSSIHIAIAFFVANLLYFIIASKDKKNIYSFLLIVTELILLLISMSMIEYNLVITNVNEVLGNIPYMIESVFSKNILTIIIGSIPINLYLYEKLKDKTYGRVAITLFDIILVFSLSYNFFNYVPFNINLILKKYSGIFATENWYYIFYFITYLVLFFISVNYYLKNKKEKIMVNTFIISSILLMIFSMSSNLFNEGNIAFIVFTTIFISVKIVKEKLAVHVKSVIALTFILVVYYLSMFSVIKYIDITRTNYIKEQNDAEVSYVEVKANPIYLVWRYNPIDYFQHRDFKEYYKIKKESSIEVKYFGVFEKIERRVKE